MTNPDPAKPLNLPNMEIPIDTWTPPLPSDDGSPLEPPPTREEFDQDVDFDGEV